jgi:hypothetical protein
MDQERIFQEITEHQNKSDDDVIPHEPRGDDIDHETEVDGYTVPVGTDETETEAIDDFRDKNDLWEQSKPLSEHSDIRDNTAITRQGGRLEEAMRKTGEWGSEPNGSVFLTRDGDWIGYGGDTDHRMSVSGAESYSGIKLEEPRPKGSEWTRSDDLDKFMRISGTARVGVRDGINADISHPLSSSQREALTDLAISRGYGVDKIYFDKNNRASDIEEDTLIRSITDFGSATADTLNGKEGVWRTINGTPIFLPDGEDAEKVISETFKKLDKSKSKSPTKQAPKSDEPQRFSEARKKHQEFLEKNKGESYSFDPKTGKGFNAFDKDQAKEMYKRYDVSDGKDPVYFISETNHQGQLSRESESAFINITNKGEEPIIGRWVSDDTGFDYTDVTYAETGLGKKGKDREIRSILRKQNQESALKLFPDGTVDFVNA